MSTENGISFDFHFYKDFWALKQSAAFLGDLYLDYRKS